MSAIDVRVQLDSLKVITQNEGSPDEPYLWVVYIKVDGTTINVANLAASGAALHAPSGSHGDLGSASDDMEDGDAVSVPHAIGRFDTALVTDGLPAAVGPALSSVAVAVVALEEDGTKDSAAEEGRKALVSTLKKEINKAIQAGISPNADQITDQAVSAVKNAIKGASLSVLSFMPITSLLDVGGIVDPDDYVGSGVAGPFTFAQIKDAGGVGIPFTLDLTGEDPDEGRYRVTGRVKRLPYVPFAGVFTPGKGGQHFVAGMSFDAFTQFWIKLGKQSPPVDMVDFETYLEKGERKFAGVFSPGKGGQHFVAGMSFDAFVAVWQKLGKQSPPVDLVDVETYVEGGQRKFAGLFTPGKGGQAFVAGLTFDAFVDLWKKNQKHSPPLDLIDVELFEEGGKRLYAGVFSPGKGGQHFVSGMSFDDFVALWKKLGKQSPPVDMTDLATWIENGQRRFAGVFSPGKGGQAFVSGLDFDDFVALWIKLGKNNPPVDLVRFAVT